MCENIHGLSQKCRGYESLDRFTSNDLAHLSHALAWCYLRLCDYQNLPTTPINSQFLASYPLTTTSRHSNSLPAPPWPERFFSTTRTSKIFPPNLPTLSASQVAFCALPDSDSMTHRAHHLPAYLLSSFASFPPSTLIKSNSPHLASAAGWL